jgi:hypothetical protein
MLYLFYIIFILSAFNFQLSAKIMLLHPKNKKIVRVFWIIMSVILIMGMLALYAPGFY